MFQKMLLLTGEYTARGAWKVTGLSIKECACLFKMVLPVLAMHFIKHSTDKFERLYVPEPKLSILRCHY